MIDDSKYKKAVYEVLPIGRRNAMYASEIIALIGGDSRRIRFAVNELRKEGVKIASGQYGYFIARENNKEDMRYLNKCIKQLLAQGNETIKVAEVMKK